MASVARDAMLGEDDALVDVEDDVLMSGPFGRVLARLMPSPMFELAAQEAVEAIQVAVTKSFGDEAWLLPFGSFVQGSPVVGSDLDLCIEVPGVEDNIGKDGKPNNANQVAALQRLLLNLRGGSFVVKETRFFTHVRVPIIVAAYVGSAGETVETDISVGTVFDGVEKGFTDRLIRRVLAKSPSVVPFVRLVKQWAKVQGLNKAFDNYLNSLGWTLLVVYFFMNNRLEVFPDALHEEEANERGVLPPPLLEADEVTPSQPSCDELASFFEMVAGFEEWMTELSEGQGRRGISITEGCEVNGPADDRSPFFLEDPGTMLAVGRQDNVARALKDHTWRLIMRKCRGAAEELRGCELKDAGLESCAAWASAALFPQPRKPQQGLKRPLEVPLVMNALRRMGNVAGVPGGGGFGGAGFGGVGFGGAVGRWHGEQAGFGGNVDMQLPDWKRRRLQQGAAAGGCTGGYVAGGAGGWAGGCAGGCAGGFAGGCNGGCTGGDTSGGDGGFGDGPREDAEDHDSPAAKKRLPQLPKVKGTAALGCTGGSIGSAVGNDAPDAKKRLQQHPKVKAVQTPKVSAPPPTPTLGQRTVPKGGVPAAKAVGVPAGPPQIRAGHGRPSSVPTQSPPQPKTQVPLLMKPGAKAVFMPAVPKQPQQQQKQQQQQQQPQQQQKQQQQQQKQKQQQQQQNQQPWQQQQQKQRPWPKKHWQKGGWRSEG